MNRPQALFEQAAYAATMRRVTKDHRRATIGLIRHVVRMKFDRVDYNHYWVLETEYDPIGQLLIRLRARCKRCNYEGTGSFVSLRHAGRRSYARKAWASILEGPLPCHQEATVRGVMAL